MKCLYALLSLSACLAMGQSVTIDGDISDWADEFLVADLGGCDDVPGQKDVILSGLAVDNPTLYCLFVFDEIGLNGGNTGDGCWLFDTDNDGFVDKAFCFTLRNNPFTLAASDIKFYNCGDNQVDRCTSAVEIPLTSLACALAGDVAEIPGYECGNGNTASVECSIDMTNEINWSVGAVLLGSCSYPSAVPNSAPSDCVVELGDNLFNVDPVAGTVPVELESVEIQED